MNIHKVIKSLASLKLTVICLLILSILVIMGTFYQVDHGLYAAKQRFFNSWFILLAGFIPTPGVKTLIALLLVNLAASGYTMFRLSWKKAGLMFIHFGIVLLLGGAAFIHYSAQESYLTLTEKESSSESILYSANNTSHSPVPLPLTITLLDFSIRTYPGSDMASDYQSKLHVKGSDIDRDAVVSMNRPFRYKDYSFYQNSYSQTDGIESTTLSIVKNSGRWLPYAASILIVIGLVLHFTMKLVLRVRKRHE